MTRRLFIAEKPSVGKAIADELGRTASGQGYIECGNDIVTWCVGHLLDQEEPDFYTPDSVPIGTSGKKVWRVDELPVFPNTWVMVPRPELKDQLKVIKGLLKNTDIVVHAGDKGREGQLIVDELLQYFGNTKPVLRYLASAIDEVCVREALQSLEDNSRHATKSLAALGRARADWLMGMNLTRAYTLRAQRGGSRTLLSVGRVQTPTLALVVQRDREIANFKPIDFFQLLALFKHDGQAAPFMARWVPAKDQAGLDTDNRLIDAAIAQALCASLKGQAASVTLFSRVPKRKAPPLPFYQTTLNAAAVAMWGYSAKDVLKAAQDLYERKLITYVRTDCPYLPEQQHTEAGQVLAALKSINPHLAKAIDKADPRIKSKAWNDKKMKELESEHHGISPTLHKGRVADLTDIERNIYDLVITSYIAQFYPDQEYDETQVEVQIAPAQSASGPELFVTKGKVVTKTGWSELYGSPKVVDDEDKGDAQTLPLMKEGDELVCQAITAKPSKTTPPKHFTEGTLPIAMEQIHKYVEGQEHKDMLREGDGIGTVATRTATITELKDKGYLATNGKALVSTELGRGVIDALPPVVKSAVLTALFERMLKKVELGQATLEAFMTKQEEFVRKEVERANLGSVVVAGAKAAAPVSTIHKCLSCGAGLSRRQGKRAYTWWWGCSNFPTCSQTYEDHDGKPDFSTGKTRKNTPSKPDTKE